MEVCERNLKMRLLSMDDFEVWLLKCFFTLFTFFCGGCFGFFFFLRQFNGITPSGHCYFEETLYFFRKLIQAPVVGGRKDASACAHHIRTFPAQCLLLFSNI